MKKKKNKLIQLLDKYERIEGSWDGGNDSGSWEVKGDLKNKKSETINFLDDIIENTLNYGSWAGNFYSSGSITYNKKTKELSFSGSESDSENREYVKTIKLKFKFPKEFIDTSDGVSFVLEKEDNNVSAIINTGTKLDIHKTITDKIEKEIEAKTKSVDIDNGETYYYDQDFNWKDIKTDTVKIDLIVEKDRIIDIDTVVNLKEYED